MKFTFTLADESQDPLLEPAQWFTDLGGKPLLPRAIRLYLEEAFKRNDQSERR
ncbi:MAG: hypothetical protein HYT78_10350 [Deltaproteobacteria bacterium]|nr:hypothetical protein [Deltaproteobacteria bacterium]